MSDQPLVLVGATNQTIDSKPDPDRPHWGLLGGVCMWVLSVVLPQILPIPFLFTEQRSGNLPSPEDIAARAVRQVDNAVARYRGQSHEPLLKEDLVARLRAVAELGPSRLEEVA